MKSHSALLRRYAMCFSSRFRTKQTMNESGDLKADLLIILRVARSQRVKAGAMVYPEHRRRCVTTQPELQHPEQSERGGLRREAVAMKGYMAGLITKDQRTHCF